MRNSDILRKARKKIEEPECWTKGNWAIDDYGDSVESVSEDATIFCLAGAIRSAIFSEDPGTIKGKSHPCCVYIMDAIKYKTGNDDYITSFNDLDKTMHSDVLEVLDKAIEVAQLEEDQY